MLFLLLAILLGVFPLPAPRSLVPSLLAQAGAKADFT